MKTPGGKEQLRRRLYIAAHQEVKSLVEALPPQVRDHARKLPVIFEMAPRPSDRKNGIESDTLGLFSGESLADGSGTQNVSPSEIILYMENLWEYAKHDAGDFREEVRRTYLHELGHYLGLGEDDLEKRDLD